MKGYKGFEKGMVCRGKQYAENTVFEEDEAVICEKGMHFCKDPFDVFNYYAPCTGGTFNEFAEVEPLGEEITDDNEKYCTNKLKIGAKLSFDAFIKAGVEFNLSKAKFNNPTEKATGNCSGASTTGYCSGAMATGDRSGASTTGYCSGAMATGHCSGAMATGDRSGASTTGYCSGAMATGHCSGAMATGNRSGASTTGYCSGAMATGDYSGASATGNCSGAMATGYCSGAMATGDYSGAMAVGDECTVEVKSNSVAMVVGAKGKAKGDIGSFIVLSEFDVDENGNRYIKDVKSAKVDGVTIKADTFYKLVGGEFVETTK